MMNLPLLMAAPAATSPAHADGNGRGTSRHGDGGGFEATLTALLGDAGKEVVDMVETLGKLADLDREHDALAAIGWPMPALLALTANGGADQAALLDELAAGLEVEGDAEVARAALVGDLAEATHGSDEAEGETMPRVERPGTSEAATASAKAAAAETAEPAQSAASVEAAEADESVGAGGADEVDEIDGARGAPSTTRSSDGAAAGASAATPGVAASTGAGGDTDHLDVEEGSVARSSTGIRAARVDAKSDEQVPGTTRDPAASDRSGSFRVDASSDRAPTAGEPLAARPEPVRPTPNAGMSSAIQRVMEAIDRLETLPPPQRLTVDLGEVRIRVSLEDGQVRMAVIDGDGDVGDELLQDARDELAQRGFDLGADGDQADGAGIPADDTHDDEPQRPRTRERVASGLRL